MTNEITERLNRLEELGIIEWDYDKFYSYRPLFKYNRRYYLDYSINPRRIYWMDQVIGRPVNFNIIFQAATKEQKKIMIFNMDLLL